MTIPMRNRAFALASLLAAASTSTAAEPALYRVDAELHYSGAALGAPSLLVQAGQPASVTISGQRTLVFQVTVHPDADDTLRVDGAVAHAEGEAPEAFMLVVAPGQPARMDAGPLRVALTVAPGEQTAR